MQYILTEEEYRALIEKRDERTRVEIQRLQDFCVLASQYIPVEKYPMSSPGYKEPWKCNLEAIRDDEMTCDECPAGDVCPCQFKQWSD